MTQSPQKTRQTRQSQQFQKTALVMAGGTGGHIFPGVAIAHALMDQGWRVVWLGRRGAPDAPTMEASVVLQQAARGYVIPFEGIEMAGVRGKGIKTKLLMPFNVLGALWQSWQVLRRVQPHVVIGMGGYVTFPAGIVAKFLGMPLVLHEQNAIAGLSNKILARLAKRVFTAFPHVLQAQNKQAQFVGNPLRAAFTTQALPAQRFAHRTGSLRLLVVGGSLGAQGLNDVLPKALALIDPAKRPVVTHQSGAAQLAQLQASYAALQVDATCTAFIEDPASHYAAADVVIARSGASTVTEIAAVGAATLFVPFPFAVDDHQTANANYLVKQDAAWLMQQRDLTPQWLADFLQTLTREVLVSKATNARAMALLDATQRVVMACEQLTENVS